VISDRLAVPGQQLIGHPGELAELLRGQPGELDLDVREAAAVCLAPLDRDKLLQVARAVESGAAAHAERLVDQSDRRVPPDRPAIGHIADTAVGSARIFGRQGLTHSLHQLVHRPHADESDTVTMTLSTSW
jgi:hypothetical protein